jgi:ferrous iron transport protein B
LSSLTDTSDVRTVGHPPSRAEVTIALVGNPNTGKSALFNRLTGGRQRVGNYPGLTVEKKEGRMRLGHRPVCVLDLPGAYSLAAMSADERVVLDVLAGHIRGTRQPDLVVCVVEARHLERQLYLVSQVAEIGLPIVLVLNMWDELEAERMTIDAQTLGKRLGVPVVHTVAYKGRGVAELKAAMESALESRRRVVPMEWPKAVDHASARLQELLSMMTGRALAEAELRRLLFDVDPIDVNRLGLVEHDWRAAIQEARELMTREGLNPAQCEAPLRFAWCRQVVDGLIQRQGPRRRGWSDRIDDLLTHRLLGMVVFVLVMWAVFQSIYTLAGPLMDQIDAMFGWLSDQASARLQDMPLLQDLVSNGIIQGVGGVLIFLPQILILFLFICMLEDAGYMPRAAFLMDRLFGWCGLSGKCFVPLLSSYACAVPGVMSTRTIEDPKARLATILIAPLMSCSARLPVYTLMIGAFIEPVYGATTAGLTLLGMHFLGLAIAVPMAWVFNRLLLRGKSTPFVLEMPPYRVPHVRDVAIRVYGRGREFVKRAGTVIFALSIVIWALSYFPRPIEIGRDIRRLMVASAASERNITPAQAAELVEQDPVWSARVAGEVKAAYLEQSYIGRAGQAVQPLFAPAGFDWKITVGVLASFPAREVIVSTLGILYHVGEEPLAPGGDAAGEPPGSDPLAERMTEARWDDGRPVFTIPVALSIMVFFALCSQCAATLAIVARESSWRWAVFMFCYMTALAWIGAVATYQIGTRLF